MKALTTALTLAALGIAAAGSFAQQRTPAAAAANAAAAAVTPAEDNEAQVEIYRIAPGQQEAFLRFTALCDEANRLAGMPPRQLYVHEDGASWDYILIQPAHNTAEQSRAWRTAADKLGIPRNHDFSLFIRQFIAEHTDTSAIGPTTAAEYLKSVTAAAHSAR